MVYISPYFIYNSSIKSRHINSDQPRFFILKTMSYELWVMTYIVLVYIFERTHREGRLRGKCTEINPTLTVSDIIGQRRSTGTGDVKITVSILSESKISIYGYILKFRGKRLKLKLFAGIFSALTISLRFWIYKNTTRSWIFDFDMELCIL